MNAWTNEWMSERGNLQSAISSYVREFYIRDRVCVQFVQIFCIAEKAFYCNILVDSKSSSTKKITFIKAFKNI